MASTSKSSPKRGANTPNRSHDETLTRAALEVLANNVTAERTKRNWSQTDLANAAGMTQQRISLIESCGTGMTIDTVARVAHVLGTTVGELLSG